MKNVHKNFITSSNLIFATAVLDIISDLVDKISFSTLANTAESVIQIIIFIGAGLVVRQGYKWTKYFILGLFILAIIGGIIFSDNSKQTTTPAVVVISLIQTVMMIWALVLIFKVPKIMDSLEEQKENNIIAATVNTENFPPLIKRFQSVIIDSIFIIICMVIFSKLLPNSTEDNTGALRGFLLFGLFFIYEPVCMAFGCTIGNYVTGIRVRKFGDEDKHINILNSYLRFIVKGVLGIISFFTVSSNDYKRAIHDMAANSIVIYARRK